MFPFEYNDFDWWYDPTPSDKEMEWNEKGFHFITNFSPLDEPFYRQSAEIHNIQTHIEDEAYGFGGHRIHGSKAFYVSNGVGDLSDFWNTFDELKGVTDQ